MWRDLKLLDEIEKEHREHILRFDRIVTAILKGGEIDDTTVVATDNNAIREAVQEVDEDHSAFQKAADNSMAAHRAVIVADREAEAAMEQLDAYGEQADLLLDKVEVAAGKEMIQAKSEGVSAVKGSVTWIIITLIVAVVAGILIGLLLSRSITKPSNRIIGGLNDGAEQVAYASGQVSSFSQSLAEGSSEQAASIEETSSSLEEMSSMTKQNADSEKQSVCGPSGLGKLVRFAHN